MSEKRTNSGYSVTDFRNLTSPIVDVRSPSEFSQGHWPGAINIPLFSDIEREIIGKSYKKESRLKAIFNGLKITLPNTLKLIQGQEAHQPVLLALLINRFVSFQRSS